MRRIAILLVVALALLHRRLWGSDAYLPPGDLQRDHDGPAKGYACGHQPIRTYAAAWHIAAARAHGAMICRHA